MYDSLGLYNNTDEVLKILKYLSDIKENIDVSSGEIITYGKLKNMKVKISDDIASIIGSLPKYFFNNNIQELSRKQTQEAIEKLSDELHLQIDNSKLFRIDVASNFILEEPLTKYYSALESLSRYEKKQYRDGILFVTNKIALEFYDKLKELKRKKQTIPEVFQGRNLLRYEIHLQKRLHEIFNKELFVKDLYNENVYMKAIDIWKDLYFRIKKKRVFTFNPKVIDMINQKTITNELALIGLSQIGKEEVLRMLELERGNISKMQFKRIKDKIISISELPELTELQDSIKELDEKVIRRAEEKR